MCNAKRQTIIHYWNRISQNEKLKLMSRYVDNHADDYSVELWLEFVYRELRIRRIEEGRSAV